MFGKYLEFLKRSIGKVIDQSVQKTWKSCSNHTDHEFQLNIQKAYARIDHAHKCFNRTRISQAITRRIVHYAVYPSFEYPSDRANENPASN